MSNNYISEIIRQLVRERANFFCEYCYSQDLLAAYKFIIEHIIPLSKGGTNDLINLALACQGCNSFKSDKTSAIDSLTNQTVKLFNPRVQEWVKHFQWNDTFEEIIGLTPTGRATVAQLKMNRTRLVNQRKIYREFGIHPPEITLIQGL